MIERPIALGLTVCEKTIVEEGTQNISLVNTFTKLFVEEFPSSGQRFSLFAVLKDGLGDGTIDVMATRIDTDEIIYQRRYPVQFPNRLVEVRVLFRVNKCVFPIAGTYLFTLLIDGEWLAQRELQVIEGAEDVLPSIATSSA